MDLSRFVIHVNYEDPLSWSILDLVTDEEVDRLYDPQKAKHRRKELEHQNVLSQFDVAPATG